jgi:CcmD family protein
LKNFESLFAAYILVWAVFFVYYFTVARRLAELREELKALKAAVLEGSEPGSGKQ